MGKEQTAKPPRQEFERKFLVNARLLPRLTRVTCRHYVQGYLQIEPIQIRLRLVDGASGILEFKGPDSFESDPLPLPLAQARYMLTRCRVEDTVLIEKRRYVLPAARGLKWEIDVYVGENAGLIVAEIELPSEKAPLPRCLPVWLGREVTDDPRFRNKRLARKPFSDWREDDRRAVLREIGRRR